MPAQQKIIFHNGKWWFHRPLGKQVIELNPLFQQCGWRVDELSAALGLGKRTFARMAEESLGKSAKLWMREIRIVKASHLLREGEKIRSTVLELEFSDEANFTREFKKLFGISPSHFIKSERSRAWSVDFSG